MKAIDLNAERFRFTPNPDGYFRLDALPCPCPEESGFTGHLASVRERLELSAFLSMVAERLINGVTNAQKGNPQ